MASALVLHPDAAKRYDELATELVSQLHSPSPGATAPENVDPGYFMRTYSPEAIHKIGLIDGFGHELARQGKAGKDWLVLDGEGFQRFARLTERMQQAPGLRDQVSLEFLRDQVLAWLLARAAGEGDSSMSATVLSRCELVIEALECWVPVALLSTEESFQLGRITLRQLTGDDFERWLAADRARHPNESRAEAEEFYTRRRSRLQGYAVAVFHARAEERRGRELAIEETIRSLAGLNFFSPAVLHPNVNGYCAIYGTENREEETVLQVRDGELVNWFENTRDAALAPWRISRDDLTFYRQHGLAVLHGVLKSDSPSAFAQDILRSLFLFTRAATARQVHDKLVFEIAALEGLLLRDPYEPIQQNLSERIAFLCGSSVQERREIIATLKQCYALRSGFLHHALSSDDTELMARGMLLLWCALRNAIMSIDRFATREELLAHIDDLRLSGSGLGTSP